MPRAPRRIPVSDSTGPLTDNPFASLQGGGAPASAVAPAAPARETPGKDAFRVVRTRKGGLPIFVEKRPGGKVVTVVRNVEGDATAALAQLKKRCGAGGVVRDGALEVQGDQRVKVEAFLLESAKIVAAPS
jgi:translation initiation factor 1